MTWGKYIDYLLYCLVIILTVIISPGANLLIHMISVDSIMSAIHFFKRFVDHKITESQIVNEEHPIYKSSILDRYIYYIISFLLYTGICNFFWIDIIRFIYYGFLFSMLPPFLNKITESSIFNIIRKKKEEMIKIVISKQLVSIIRLISKTYLKKDIEIHHSELLSLFDDYSKMLDYSIDIIKNLGVIIGTVYVKKYSASFYYTMLKYIYNYKTGVELESFNERLAKIKLINIIEGRKWKELFNPNVYKAIIHLYQMNVDDSNLINDAIHTFYYTIAKMFASWSLSSFLKQVLSGPIISLFMIFYRNEGDNFRKICVVVSAGVIGFFTQNFFLTNVICHFGYYIIFSRIMISILHFFKNESIKKFNELNAINANYVMPTIMIALVSSIMSIYFHPTIIIMILMEIARNIFIDKNYRRMLIYLMTFSTSFLSSFNLLHIIHNTIIIYVTIGIINDELFFIIMNEVRKLLSNLYIDISNERIQLTNDAINIFNVFYQLIKTKFISQPNFQKIRFEIMNEEVFPSVSQKIGCVSQTTKDDIIKLGNPLNDQLIEKKISSNMLEIDERLFTLKDTDFIDAISVESDENFIDSILIKSVKESKPPDKYDSEIEIIEDFCTSK